jgi:hypothetical protein
MRPSLLSAVLALSLTAATKPDKQQWGFTKSDGDVRLYYGVPESESVTLSFICQPKRKKITIVSLVLPDNPRPKRPGTIRLSNGSSVLEYAGMTERDSSDSEVIFVAAIPVDQRIFEFMEEGAFLQIDTLGSHERVPLHGIKGPLAQMRKTCR